MKSRKGRKAKQATGLNNFSLRLKPLAREIRSLKQKALTAIHAIGYTLLLSHVTFIPYAHAAPTGGTVINSGEISARVGRTTMLV